MKFVQVRYEPILQTDVRFRHSIGNIRRSTSYFEKFGLHFDVIPDDESGLGDMVLAVIRFHSGEVALLGTRPTNRDRGVELFSPDKDSAPVVLKAVREQFSDIRDEEIQLSGV